MDISLKACKRSFLVGSLLAFGLLFTSGYAAIPQGDVGKTSEEQKSKSVKFVAAINAAVAQGLIPSVKVELDGTANLNALVKEYTHAYISFIKQAASFRGRWMPCSRGGIEKKWLDLKWVVNFAKIINSFEASIDSAKAISKLDEVTAAARGTWSFKNIMVIALVASAGAYGANVVVAPTCSMVTTSPNCVCLKDLCPAITPDDVRIRLGSDGVRCRHDEYEYLGYTPEQVAAYTTDGTDRYQPIKSTIMALFSYGNIDEERLGAMAKKYNFNRDAVTQVWGEDYCPEEMAFLYNVGVCGTPDIDYRDKNRYKDDCGKLKKLADVKRFLEQQKAAIDVANGKTDSPDAALRQANCEKRDQVRYCKDRAYGRAGDRRLRAKALRDAKDQECSLCYSHHTDEKTRADVCGEANSGKAYNQIAEQARIAFDAIGKTETEEEARCEVDFAWDNVTK